MKKLPTKKRKIGNPVFVYVSVCCNAVAEKPACEYVGLKSKEAETQGLGSWRCGTCKKPCSVSRSKFVPEKLN